MRSVITGSAANVSEMRHLPETENNNDEKLNAITNESSAHILNLLTNFVHYPNINEQIIKHFRNNHLVNECYRATGVSKLILSSEILWNSIVNSLDTYVKIVQS